MKDLVATRKSEVLAAFSAVLCVSGTHVSSKRSAVPAKLALTHDRIVNGVGESRDVMCFFLRALCNAKKLRYRAKVFCVAADK
ncbi:hypothetical protein [Paraburkholderia acidicola]|uniref:hypothetical protein n=1 Tax=Paraburkholderia acidicola TaxID=1912599 RepID=UPI0010550BE7|nr:hypothetical protein [Paraburkholderia acidicola]